MPELAYYEVTINVTFQPVDRYTKPITSASYIELRRKINANDMVEVIKSVDQIGDRSQ